MLDTMERQQMDAEPLRRPALVAGLGLLAMAVLAGATNALVIEGLVTLDDPTQTAQDVLASEGLFRLGIVALLVVAVLDVVVAWGLYAFLTPADEGLSRLAAWLRFGYAAIFATGVAHLVGAVNLLGSSAVTAGADADRLRADALAQIATFHDIWGLGLAVFGVHLAVVGYVTYVSGYVPRWLGAAVVVAGVGYLIDSIGEVLVAPWPITLSLVTFVGEVVLMLWLLVRGRLVVPGTES
jgi:hypothetical protein